VCVFKHTWDCVFQLIVYEGIALHVPLHLGPDLHVADEFMHAEKRERER